MTKTNAVRMLEAREIDFTLTEYEADENDLSAAAVAAKLGLDIDRVFKTLVLRSCDNDIFVCVVPGACELDLKKAAKAHGCKKADLIPVKELLPLTGYIRGGCSPIGMKKNYPTYIDETCEIHESIFVSAGVRGLQICLPPGDLLEIAEADSADLV